MLWSSTQVHFSSLGPCLSAWLSMLVLNAIFQLGCLRSFSLKMSWLLHIDCFTVPPNTAFRRQRWPIRNNSNILKHHQHSVRRIECIYCSFVWIVCTQNCRPFWPHPPPTCILTVLPILDFWTSFDPFLLRTYYVSTLSTAPKTNLICGHFCHWNLVQPIYSGQPVKENTRNGQSYLFLLG